MACTAYEPMPFHWKIVSVSTDAVSSWANENPRIVSVGSHALRSTWRRITSRSARPLARAVRT